MLQSRKKANSKVTFSKYSVPLTFVMIVWCISSSSAASASSNLAKSLVPDVQSRHFSVNPSTNTVVACGSSIDLRNLNRVSRCFISLTSTKGYWLNLGDLFDRVLGFDSKSNYFILADRQNKFHLLTRDGTVFYPVNNVDDYLNRQTFYSSVNATSSVPSSRDQSNMVIDLNASQWTSEMGLLISNQNKPVSVWS